MMDCSVFAPGALLDTGDSVAHPFSTLSGTCGASVVVSRFTQTTPTVYSNNQGALTFMKLLVVSLAQCLFRLSLFPVLSK